MIDKYVILVRKGAKWSAVVGRDRQDYQTVLEALKADATIDELEPHPHLPACQSIPLAELRAALKAAKRSPEDIALDQERRSAGVPPAAAPVKAAPAATDPKSK